MMLAISGLDEHADKLVSSLAGALNREATEGSVTLLSYSSGNFIQDFRQQLIALVEAQRSANQHVLPRFVFFISAFADDYSAGLDLLKPLTDIIRTILPAQQSVVLSVIFPPFTASDSEKINTYRFFLALEDIIGNIPLFNIVFVNQLSKELYQDCSAEIFQSDPLFKLIRQQILSSDLRDTIYGIGRPAVEHQYTCANRKCCYSTSGLYQLYYHHAESMAHIRAEVESHIYEKGLMNIDALTHSQDVARNIQQQADQFIGDLIQDAKKTCIPPGQIKLKVIASTSDLKAIIQEANQNKNHIHSTVTEHEKEIEKFQSETQSLINQKLNNCLTHNPGYFAAAKLYGNILSGNSLTTIYANHPQALCGGPLFCHEVCEKPTKYSLKRLKTEFGEYLGYSVIKPSVLSDFLTTLENLDCEFAPDQINNLVDDISDRYTDSVKSMCDDYQQLEKDFHLYKKNIGWMGRILTKRKALKQKQTELEEKYEILVEKQIPDISDIFVRIISKLLLPFISRVLINQAFQAALEQTVSKLNDFFSDIETALEDRCKKGIVNLKVYQTATAESIPDKNGLNKLFNSIVDPRGPAEDAARVIENLPENPSPNVFLERLSNYCTMLIQPVSSLNILDIIELDGSETAYTYLEKTLENTNRFLEFSTGRLARVEQENRMNDILLVRSDDQINNRLSSGYPNLFGSETRFIGNNNPYQIDCVRLIFGFPAFPIHGLKECRALLLNSEQEDGLKDLWPQ